MAVNRVDAYEIKGKSEGVGEIDPPPAHPDDSAYRAGTRREQQTSMPRNWQSADRLRSLAVHVEEDIPVAALRSALDYDPGTGRLTWRPRTPDMFEGAGGRRTPCQLCSWWNEKFAGSEAFANVNARGYKAGRVFNKMRLAHRVAWAIQTGAWPVAYIDHINGDTTDNRIENLRQATPAQNTHNRRADGGSSSQFLGVCRFRDKWKATINVGSRSIHLGVFDREEDAARAFDAEAIKRRGAFAKLNFPE